MASIWDQYLPVQQQQKDKKESSIWDQYVPKPDEASQFDLVVPEPPPPSRGLFGAVNDYVIEAANAVLGGVKSVVDFAQPGTELAASIQALVDEGERNQSAVARQAKQELAQGLSTSDIGDQLGAVGKYIVQSPGLAISQAVGSFVTPGAAIKGARGLGTVLGAGERAVGAARAVGPITPGAARAAGEAALTRYGTGGGVVAGAALSGGDAASQAYQQVLEATGDEQQALAAARAASVVPAAVGGLTGAFGAERLFAGKGGAVKGGVLRTGASEAGQEFVEEGVTQLSANVATSKYVPETDIMQGVVGAAALGGALGGITGAGVGLITRTPKNTLTTEDTTLTREQDAATFGPQINEGLGLTTQDLINRVTGVARQQSENTRESMLAALNEPSGQFTTDQQGIERQLTAGELAGVPAVQAAKAQATQQQAQQVAQAELNATAQQFGAKQTSTAGWNIAGVQIFGVNRLNEVLSQLTQANREKSDVRKTLDAAAIASGLVQAKGTGNGQKIAKSILSSVDKQLVNFQVDEAQTVEEAADIVNQQIAALGEQGKGVTDKQVDALARFYDSLTGTEAPAFTALSQSPAVATKAAPAATPVSTATPTPAATPSQPKMGLVTGAQAPSEVTNIPVEQYFAQGGTVDGQRLSTAPQEGGGQRDRGVPTQVQAGEQATGLVVPQGGQESAPDVGTEATQEVGIGQRTWESFDTGGVTWDSLSDRDQRDFKDLAVQRGDKGFTQEEITQLVNLLKERDAQIKAAQLVNNTLEKVLTTLFPRKTQKDKVQYYLRMLGGERVESVAQTAVAFGKAKDTIKEWNQTLNKLLANSGQLIVQARAILAKEGVSPQQAMDAIQTLEDRFSSVIEQETERQDMGVEAADLGESVVDERELGDVEGELGTKEGRTSLSVSEFGNKKETLNARYARLAEAYDEAVAEGNEELATELQEKIDETLEEITKGKKRAVQKPSTAKVDVRQRTEAGEKVAKGDTEGQKAASESKTEAKGEVATTPKISGAEVTLLPPVEGFEKQKSEAFSVKGFGAYVMLFHSTDKNQNIWSIPRFRADKPGEGSGSKLFKAVTDWADKTGATLTITAAADTQSGKKLSQEELVKFYEKRGFEPDARSLERIEAGGSYSTLVRYPQTEVALTTEEATQAAYEKLVAMLPEGALPAYGDLTVAQKEALMSIPAEELNMRNLQRLMDESNIIDVEARVIPEQEQRLLLTQTNKLAEADVKTLEKEYGAKRGSKEFIAKLHADVTTFVNRGAQYVAENIRAIIQQVAKLAVAAAIVFNPNITGNGFNFNLQDAYAKVHSSDQQVTVPKEAASQMSDEAKIVYQQLAPLAQQQQRGFIIADKKTGKIHFFYSSGQHMASDAALYGKDVGDKFQGDSLKGGKKITPAGKFTLKATQDSEYAGGWRLDLVETSDGKGIIAVHPAWLGNTQEKRLERLASADAKDNRISYGCINTSHDLFLNKVKPQLGEFDGGMIFVVPDAPLAPAQPAPAKTPQRNAMRRRAEEKVQELTDDTSLLQIEDVSLDEMTEAYKGIADLKAHYESLGLGNAFDAVGQFFVSYNNDVDWEGIVTSVDNQVAIVLRQDVAANPNVGRWTMAHEVGHAVDQTVQGENTFSSDPKFNLRVVNGKVIPMGEIATEMANVHSKDLGGLQELMNYPFDKKENEGLSNDEVRQELFAQVWAMYTSSPNTRRLLETHAPKTASFLKEAVNRVQQTKDFKAKNLTEGPTFYSGKTGVDGARGQAAGAVGEGGAKPKVNKSVRAAIDKLPQAARPQSELFTNVLETLGKTIPTFAFTTDLVDIAKKYMPSVKAFFDLHNEQNATTTKYELKVRRILDAYDTLPNSVKGTGPNSVNKFLGDSTKSGKWGFKFREDSNVTLDPNLKARFEAFPPEAQQVIKAVFKHGYETLQDMKKAVRENISSEYDALIAEAKKTNDQAELAKLQKAKDDSLKDYERLLAVAGKKPYAPLKRFGDYVVVGKSQALLDAEKAGNATEIRKLKQDPRHYYVSFAETKGAGQTIANAIRGKYDFVSDAFEKSAEESLYGGSDMNQVFSRLRTLVNNNMDAATSVVAERGMRKLINDLHFAMLGQQSALHATNERLGVAGADEDMMRSFATQGRATAHFIGSVTNTEKIYEALRKMKEEAGSNADARKYFNEFVRRQAMNYDYQPNPVINKAMATTSLWMLLTSPGYYLQNATQPFMMSVPFMAGRFGYARTQAELFGRGYKDTMAILKEVSLGQQVDYSKLPADVREAVQNLVNRGRIDISLEQDLGAWRSSEDSKFKVFGRIASFLHSSAQKVEMMNRIATAITAYRLAKADGSTEAQATDYADKVIQVTHGDYTGANAPRFMRRGIGRLVTQFRKFQLIQISMMARMVNDAFRNAKPEERLAARKALFWTFTHAGIMGGIIGLPAFAAAAAAYGMLFGDEDEPFDAEKELRDLFGPELATLMTRGVPAAFGADLSGKVGMGQMLSILPYADIDLTKSGWEKTVTAASGPFLGGLVPRAIGGLEHMQQGNIYKGFEQLAPKGVGDAMKAYRRATEGESQKNNDTTLSADEFDAFSLFLTAAGINPSKVAEKQFKTGVTIETDKFYTERTTELKRKYAKAYREGDAEGMREARESWLRLQTSRVNNGYTRQPLQNLLKSPMEQRKRERETVGGVQFTTQNRRFVQSLQ